MNKHTKKKQPRGSQKKPNATREAYALAGETGIDPRTIKRWLAGESVMPANAALLEQAQARLASA